MSNIPKQISTIQMHISNLVKTNWNLLSYCAESKIQMYYGQITLSKIDEICPLAITKQISTISMHIASLVKIHWYLLNLSSRNENTDMSRQITLSKIEEIRPSAIRNQVSTISIHTPSLVKIHWHLLKLSTGNENTDLWRADNSVKNWWNLPINNPKPDLHNINTHTKFGENPLTFIYSSHCPEMKIWMDRPMYDRQMDRQRDKHSNISSLGATSMLNFHMDLGTTQIRLRG